MSPERSKPKSENPSRKSNDKQSRARQPRHSVATAGEQAVATALVQLLTKRKETLALAESCTGGYIANQITNVSGASKMFKGGIVSYSNEAKEKFLGVSATTLKEHGAVSKEVAAEMAAGARKHFDTDYAVSVTGIAGPTGGTKAKPTGTVFIGVAGPFGLVVERHLNRFSREKFKEVTAQQALQWLIRNIGQ